MNARILVLADTHLRPGQLERLPTEVWNAADRADLIIHAGDMTCQELLDALTKSAPVHAVRGNNDLGHLDGLPDTLDVQIAGVAIGVVHDSGPRAGRENRMHRRFPDAALVVFGHSHEPVDVVTGHGQQLFNPGSPTTRRRQPRCSYGWVIIANGVPTTRIVLL